MAKARKRDGTNNEIKNIEAQLQAATSARPNAGTRTFFVDLWNEARARVEDGAVCRGSVRDVNRRILGSFSTDAKLMGAFAEASGLIIVLGRKNARRGDPRSRKGKRS